MKGNSREIRRGLNAPNGTNIWVNPSKSFQNTQSFNLVAYTNTTAFELSRWRDGRCREFLEPCGRYVQERSDSRVFASALASVVNPKFLPKNTVILSILTGVCELQLK